MLHPRTAAARRVDRSRTFGSHVRGYTVQTDDILALVRQQRRTSIRYLLAFLVPAGLVLVAFALAPEITEWRLGRVPLSWVVLGPIALFSIVLIAWLHDRRALHIEDEWSRDHSERDA